jgi:tRNA modification GTPase
MPLGFPFGELDLNVLQWPGVRSYTGQPSAEFHLIGSRPLLQRVVDCCCEAGARLAQPGEFTLRAFLAGRLDLTQAEAVLGVIDADSERGLRGALEQLTGGISAPLQQLRGQLLELLADVEAALDFVDEDIQFISDAQLAGRLQTIASRVDAIAQRMRQTARAGEAPLIALWGPANAGKSSLLNYFSGQDSAIVSHTVGTTRDPVEVRIRHQDRELRIVDTAGLERRAAGPQLPLDGQMQSLTEQTIAQADVVLWCQDWAAPDDDRPDPPEGTQTSAPLLRVATKSDLLAPARITRLTAEGWLPVTVIEAPASTATAPAALLGAIDAALESSGDDAVVGTTATRCRQSLQAAAAGLSSAATVVQAGGGQELVAAEIRLAIDAVGQVTGEVYTDEILDSIFSRFCIGK